MRTTLALALAFVSLGCAPQSVATAQVKSETSTAGEATPAPKAPEVKAPEVKTPEAPAATPAAEPQGKPVGGTAAPGATEPKPGDDIAVLTTSQGTIWLKFFKGKAPGHVENFEKLAKKGFYDGTLFHRVIQGFMIQGGDPNTKKGAPETWGTGGPGYQIKAEFNDIPHTPGILSMARSSDPDSAGSQFFIVHKASPNLDGQYTVFGQVVKGMDVVNKIAETPTAEQDRPVKPQKLIKVEIKKWPIS